MRHGWELIEDADPKRVTEYADILTMTFEGSFYDVVNPYYPSDCRKEEKFMELLEKYGLYYELGNSWNLSLFPA